MKLSPQQAPLYGECVLTVQLDDDDVGEEQEEEVEFYLLFLGSTQRHLASTLRVSHVTLQAVCPAHNVCEQVLVTLCLARPGGPVDTHSQEIFCFVQDLALDMAHFLLNNTAPQEALLLDDEQIPLKECERLDQSLALALKHLTLCHQRTSPGLHTHSRDALINTLTLTDMDRHIDSRAVTHTRTQTDTATDTHTHTGTDRHSTEAWLDSCSAQSQCQQHSSLLHLAAGHGLRKVASFLLQQPGGRDALRRTNAQGQTPACLAKTRGHQQLLELFTQYETSSDIQVEPKDQLHFYPGGRVFQHHSNLGTYTLTFSSLKQREGDAGTESSGGCRLQDEVAELRRLIQLHRDKKGISDLGGTITLKHASTSLSINHEQFSPDWELRPRSNSQQESEEGAGLAVVTIENCSTITEEQGSPSSLEKRQLGEDSAVVTQTPCTTGTLCQSQETGGEQKGTPTAISHAGRSRKNKRRTTKTTRCATESPGNNRGTPEAGKGTAQRQPKTTGSVTEGTQSPIEPVVGSVIGEARATKNLCSPGTEETQLPINPSGPGGDENCTDRKAVALPTTTVVEKQEGEKWEVELLISDRVIETETLTETEQGDTDSRLVNETNPHSALEPAAGRKVTMGQEQSQDPQESQPDLGDPSQPDSTHKSPQPGRRTSPRSLDTQRKPHRVLWRDGGQTGSRMESPPHRPEMVANTVWYQDENSDQGANEDSNIKAVNSLSVWYDADTVDQRKTEQLEQGTREQKECDLSSAQASGLSAPQLLEQGLSSRQLSAALSQPHAVGTQPVLSHGPGAQRREVHGSQQEEEVAAEWKERGREKVSNRETTYIRKSSETVELEEGGEEKPESEEIGAKGRKKRRKKRGKRGGTEAKLSSSSSIESQSQIEVQAQREQVTNLNTQSDTASEAKDITGRADVQSPRTPEPTRREEADKDAMHLPSQTEGQTRGTHGPDCVTNSESSYTTSGFSSTELEQTELTDGPASRELSEEDSANLLGPDDLNPDSRVTASELNEMDRKTEIVETVYPMRTELLDPAEIKLKGLTSPDQQTMDNVESKALSAENEDFTVAGKAVASVNWTGLVKSNCPEELPVKHSDPTEFTEDSFLVEFPEQNTQHVQSVDSNKAVQPVDPNGKPTECMESEQPTEAVGQTHLVGARSLPFEGTADVSPLQIREGSAETTMREYLEHCFASEMLRDQQHKKEKKKELWVDDEEVGKERKRNDNEMVHGTELFSIHEGKKVEGEEFPSIDREKEQQKYNEDLVATAVAVVTVAIASALASIEVNQQLADNQSEIKESASKAAANDPPLPLDANAPTDNDNTFNIIQSTQMTAQLINKDKDNCQLLADSHTAETVSQHLLIKPTVSSEEQANTRLPTDSHSVELQSQTETEHPQTPQLGSNEHANPDLSTLAETSSLPQLDKQEIQTETKKNKFLTCSLSDLPKEDSLLEVNIKSLPEANEMIITEVDSRGHMLTGIQLQQKSQLPCPVIDTGQHPEASAISCLDSEENPKLGEHSEPQDQSLCRKESEIQAESELESHFEGHDKNDSYPIASVTAENEVGGQVQRDSSDKSKAGHSESERCENSFTDMQAKKCKSIQHLDGQVHTPYEREIPTLPLSTLPVTPRDSAPVADSSSEELTPPVNLETGKFQSSHSLLDMKLDAGSGSFQCKDHKSGAMDNKDSMFKDLDKDSDTLDTVDGWKERERNNMKRDEETKKEMVTAADTSQTETFPAAKEEPQQTRNDSDSIHTLHIQRERDVFYPVHPCPEPSTVTACSAVCPDREECVSVCLLQSNSESLKVSADLDDNVFKKPVDPAPRVGDRGRGIRVSWSSTNDASTQGAFSPNEGVSSVDTSDTMAPCSSRHSWKSETEERGGGETEGGGGEEEEKKDKLPENPVSSAILRASIRSLSPYRRHSWEPGRNATADMDVAQRSSLKSLSGEVKRAKPPLHRRSMSWCPSNLLHPDQEQIDNRSYSLEGLVVESEAVQAACPSLSDQEERTSGRSLRLDGQHRGSLVSLTEEEQEGDGIRIDNQTSRQVLSMATHCPAMFHHQTLTKSISMVAISHQDVDVTGFPRSKRRISFSLSISPLLPKNRHFFSIGTSYSEEEEGGGRASSFSSNSGSLEYSISEEEPGPLRSETEGKGGAKISRTFSYLRSKMSKKGKEKEKERRGEKERESKEREKKTANGHLFIPVSPSPSTACQHCIKPLHNKDAFLCNNCGVNVHKSCRESLAVCTKSKTKQQSLVPEAVPGSAVNMRSKSTSSASSFSSTSSSSSRERWSTVTTPDDQLPVVFSRRHPSIFNSHSNLAKSISTSNIAGLDDVPLKGLKSLSQSTDSLHQGSKVNASTESLTDEGTEMMDSQLMGEFECDIKDLEADSWSGTVDKKFLKTLKKDEIKRQDVIYEMYQTEFHHVRTLKIMSEVYYKGIQKELQLDTHTLDKIFPVLDDLLHTHTRFLTLLLEQKRASSAEGQNNNSFLICSIGEVLVNQFSGCSADRMKKVYGKFCSRHNEAVNLYKDLHAKDKRFQAFIKRIMSSSIVRRLSIPECILLVTQRITKYPVLIQRILQHTKDTDEDHSCVSEALRCVKELITAVDSKVNEQEKKRRLREVYSRTDSKSIMRMKSGQMFAKEDLIRGRKLLHDGALQLKNSAGRLKDVHAMLLSDVLVFLQEKDQKYVFASLDQRSTVISLQNLIVREVANEERGLFLITAGIERPEMVEVLASSKEERITWRAIIQDAMHCMEKDEDEGVPSETEEDRRQQENRAKEIRELLRRKDEQIISLLEEKVHIFRDLGDCNPVPDDINPQVRERMLFRATPDDVTKGEPIIKDALREVETLHALLNSGVGGAGCSVPVGLTGGSVGSVCLPRRAETFGGFDSHQMNSSKNGEKEEGDESLDLRRTESDSVLKKGATASLQMLVKRNNEVQHSVTHLHDLLISLQAVVLQQDSFIEDQRQAMNERLTTNSSRHSSSSSLSSSSSSRPSSLIEQEKHRSLERQRQEAASLQKQQAAHQEEKKRREKEWELKEKSLAEREERLQEEEEETGRRRQELAEEKETLQRKKDEYQRDLERLKEAQRRLERDKEALRRDTERLEAMRRNESEQFPRYQRTPSTTSEDSIRFQSSGSLDLDSKEAAEQSKEVELSSSAPVKEPFLRIGSKKMGKNFNPFSSSSSSSSKTQGAEKESQLPTRLLQLAKPKEKKDKKKKKGKGGEQTQTESKVKVMSDPQNDGDIFFC